MPFFDLDRVFWRICLYLTFVRHPFAFGKYFGLNFVFLNPKRMSLSAIKFNTQDQPEFFKELRKRVNLYFKENNISRYGNFGMKVKTGFMLSLYIIPFALMLTGVVTGSWPVLLLWVIMGIGVSGVGLSIMHDANHGSYSRNKTVNKILGYTINLLGGYHNNWKIQHNMLHHSYTNVDGYDNDISNPVMRFSPNQKRKKFFRFQAFYAPFFYGIMTLYWIIGKDFVDISKYKKDDLLKKQNLTYGRALMHVIINKVWYIGFSVGLPLLFVDVPGWQIILGFVLMHFIAGLILSLIFQPAHVQSQTHFYVADDHGSVENNWAIHQMHTTGNFANDSRAFTWFVGGLNYQIEHHLFPNICHVHYRKISKIVKATAKEFNVPYYEHKTFVGALRSHFLFLNDLGTGKYDRNLTAA